MGILGPVSRGAHGAPPWMVHVVGTRLARRKSHTFAFPAKFSRPQSPRRDGDEALLDEGTACPPPSSPGCERTQGLLAWSRDPRRSRFHRRMAHARSQHNNSHVVVLEEDSVRTASYSREFILAAAPDSAVSGDFPSGDLGRRRDVYRRGFRAFGCSRSRWPASHDDGMFSLIGLRGMITGGSPSGALIAAVLRRVEVLEKEVLFWAFDRFFSFATLLGHTFRPECPRALAVDYRPQLKVFTRWPSCVGCFGVPRVGSEME